MIRLQRILFPTDFSESSERAFDWALLLARQFGAELHMFHAVVLHEDDPHNPAHHFPDPEDVRQRLETLAHSAMDDQRQRGAAAEVRIRRIESRGISAAPTILDYAGGWDADLIVMGTQGRRGPSHLLLGSVAEEIVSHARCSVMTVRAGEDEAPVEAVERILVPVDFSDHSRRSLVVARELARRYGAVVQVVHVVEDVIQPSYFGKTMNVTKELVKRASAALADLVAETGDAAGVEQGVVVGHRPVTEILEFAEDNDSDLLVVASHGLGGVEEFLFGSTAKRLVQGSPVPVLALRAFGKSLLAGDG